MMKVRITLSFIAAVKMDKMKNIQNFMLNHITIFPKKLAEKSYLTLNLRLSMVWAAAAPIKTNRSLVCHA